MTKRSSKEVEQNCIELYSTAKNLKRVSEQTGIHKTTVHRILKRNGVNVYPNKSGEDHPAWKGGINMNKGDGYIGLWKPGHERADGGNYVYEHTLVWEQNTGKLPQKNEVLHHIDLDKHNNNFNNLYLCGHRKHLELHRKIEKLIKPLIEKGIIKFENGDYMLV